MKNLQGACQYPGCRTAIDAHATWCAEHRPPRGRRPDVQRNLLFANYVREFAEQHGRKPTGKEVCIFLGIPFRKIDTAYKIIQRERKAV